MQSDQVVDIAKLGFTLKDVVVVGVIIGSWYSLKERVKVVETKLDPIYDEWIERKPKAKAAGA